MTLLRRRSISRNTFCWWTEAGENGVGGWARSGFCLRCASSISVRERAGGAWLESNETSCILYTSGTVSKPKGVQRATSAVACGAGNLDGHHFWRQGGRRILLRASISAGSRPPYIVYAPLLAGMAHYCLRRTADVPGLVGSAENSSSVARVNRMFSFRPDRDSRVEKFPTAQTVITISSLEALYLAGEPLDCRTASCDGDAGVPVIDNYWQTESATIGGAGPARWTTGRRVWEVLACRCTVITSSYSMKSPATPAAAQNEKRHAGD